MFSVTICNFSARSFMKTRRRRLANILLLTGMVLMVLPVFSAFPGAAGASPWQWEMNLGVEDANIMGGPTALFVDGASERYYVVDAPNNLLLSFDRQGKFLSGFDAGGQMRSPFDMLREPGKIWVVEKGRNAVSEIDLQRKKVDYHELTADGRRIFPDRLERAGEIFYLLDKASGDIFSLDADFGLRQRFRCDDCRGGFVDFKVTDGRLWALSRLDKVIYGFEEDGTVIRRIALSREAGVAFPCSLAVGPGGVFYVLDRHAGDIAVFDGNGGLKYRFLGPGHARGLLSYPVEIRFDRWGRLCVVDEGNARIQIFSRQ